MCPAIIFAKSLTDKLIGLDIYEIISIGTSNNNIGLGTPLGAKKPRNFNNPCLKIAMKVAARNIKNAIAKVTIIWLVHVKLKGIIPIRLPIRIKKNKVKMNGKYLKPSLPI